MKNYETPVLLVMKTDDEDIIATSNGIDLPDIPLNSIMEDEIM